MNKSETIEQENIEEKAREFIRDEYINNSVNAIMEIVSPSHPLDFESLEMAVASFITKNTDSLAGKGCPPATYSALDNNFFINFVKGVKEKIDVKRSEKGKE